MQAVSTAGTFSAAGPSRSPEIGSACSMRTGLDFAASGFCHCRASEVVPEPIARTSGERVDCQKPFQMRRAKVLERFECAKLRCGPLSGVFVQLAEITPQKETTGVACCPHLDQIAAQMPAYLVDAGGAATLTLEYAQCGAVRCCRRACASGVGGPRLSFWGLSQTEQARPGLTVSTHSRLSIASPGSGKTAMFG